MPIYGLYYSTMVHLFTGIYVRKLSKVDKEYKEKNAKTKVYYEDFSEKFVVEANKKIVEDLNSLDIIPIKWYTLSNQKEATGIANSKYTSTVNDLRKKVENGNFKVSNDGTKIVFEKQYTDLVAQLEDIQNIYYLELLLIKNKIDVVYHLAAIRNIHACELNILACINTNLKASMHLYELCVKHSVKFIFASSLATSQFSLNNYALCKFIAEKNMHDAVIVRLDSDGKDKLPWTNEERERLVALEASVGHTPEL